MDAHTPHSALEAPSILSISHSHTPQQEHAREEAHQASAPVDPRITKSCWQYQATKNVAAAAVLHDVQAEHLRSGA